MPPPALSPAPTTAPRHRAPAATARPGTTDDPVLRHAALALAGVAVVFALVVLVAAVVSEPGDLFHPDSERRVASTVSALALVAAGLAAVRAGARTGAGWQLVPVGALLLLMALDEWAALHERLEATTGTDWQLLYLPVFAVAGACFLLAARRHRGERAFLVPWLAGAACWAVSQVLELAQWDGDDQRAGYRAMMLPEEVLELTGSLLFLLAALVLLRRRVVLPETRVLAAR